MAVTLTNLLLLALLVFILVLVIRTRKLFPVVVLAGAYSLVSAAMFVNLDAVDVAFTEAPHGYAPAHLGRRRPAARQRPR